MRSSRATRFVIPDGVLALVALFGLLGLACEQILGLGDYQEGDGAPPCDACTTDASIDVTDAGPADVFQLPDGVSEASSWARWRIQNAAIEVADGAPDSSLAAFVLVADAGVIFDNVSKSLTWNANTPVDGGSTFEQAFAWCAGLPGGNWRLPTRIELVTLLDTTRTGSGTAFVSPVFDGVVVTRPYWTSSYERPVSGKYWFVNFLDGNVERSLPAQGGVICVRSN